MRSIGYEDYSVSGHRYLRQTFTAVIHTVCHSVVDLHRDFVRSSGQTEQSWFIKGRIQCCHPDAPWDRPGHGPQPKSKAKAKAKAQAKRNPATLALISSPPRRLLRPMAAASDVPMVSFGQPVTPQLSAPMLAGAAEAPSMHMQGVSASPLRAPKRSRSQNLLSCLQGAWESSLRAQVHVNGLNVVLTSSSGQASLTLTEQPNGSITLGAWRVVNFSDTIIYWDRATSIESDGCTWSRTAPVLFSTLPGDPGTPDITDARTPPPNFSGMWPLQFPRSWNGAGM